MQVRDCMTSDVFTIGFEKKALPAEEIMRWANIRHVPVVDEFGSIVGLITHRDLLRASTSNIATTVSSMESKQHLWTIPILKLMRTDVVTIDPEATIQEAARIMRDKKVGCLPVVFHNRLVGIITEFDLLSVVARLPDVEVENLLMSS